MTVKRAIQLYAQEVAEHVGIIRDALNETPPDTVTAKEWLGELKRMQKVWQAEYERRAAQKPIIPPGHWKSAKERDAIKARHQDFVDDAINRTRITTDAIAEAQALF